MLEPTDKNWPALKFECQVVCSRVPRRKPNIWEKDDGSEFGDRYFRARPYERTFEWRDLDYDPQIMMVLYLQPVVALALKAKGINPDTASLADRSRPAFQDIRDMVMEQVLSFLEIGVQGLNFVPEIVHTGLGLGYDVQTGRSLNPLDGTAITDPEVILASRSDRAMTEANLDLKRDHPELVFFPSCTRLCEVRTLRGELVATMKTGRLKLKPQGEQGISTRLRTIHGGLFPQSDLVVADDPLAEIAALTWIDEYARLDRSQLMRLPYHVWLAQTGPEVVAAVNEINGSYLPNTIDGPLDDNWIIQVNPATSY